jgi:hypothetical protein
MVYVKLPERLPAENCACQHALPALGAHAIRQTTAPAPAIGGGSPLPPPCSSAPATPPSRLRDGLLRLKAFRRYPMRKVTTPVPVEGGVAGGALPMSAGTSFQGRRKPNESACQRRTMRRSRMRRRRSPCPRLPMARAYTKSVELWNSGFLGGRSDPSWPPAWSRAP